MGFTINPFTKKLDYTGLDEEQQNFVESPDATPVGFEIDIPLDSSIFVTGKISGIQTGGTAGTIGDVCAFEIQILVKNIGGTSSLITQNYERYKDNIDATLNISVDDPTDKLEIEIVGEANKTIKWTSNISLTRKPL